MSAAYLKARLLSIVPRRVFHMNKHAASAMASVLLLTLFAVNVGCTVEPDGLSPAEARRLEEAVRASDIDRDEVVVFFNTAAHRDKDGDSWIIPIHGVIYEPNVSVHRRRAMVLALGRFADDSEDLILESRNLIERLDYFLVDNERGQDIAVRIGDKVFEVGESAADGHFDDTIRLSDAEVKRLIKAGGGKSNALEYEAITPASDERKFTGQVQLIGPSGLSIISDIDDTIKHSQVGDPEAVLENTFLRDFQPIPGMPKIYQACEKQETAFHYVSGSPWQLYLPLVKFLAAEGYPRGSFDLKQFRLKDPSTAVGMLNSPQESKSAAIERILSEFPQRRFILIGDSGERDPEIYGEATGAHRDQVVGIFIRNVTHDKMEDARFQKAAAELDGVTFHLFNRPEEIQPLIENLQRQYGAPSASLP